MAGYTTLKVGSRGSEVSQLQELLKKAGYNVSVDGIFGNQTSQAVRDYQTSKGLLVDGIAGSQTWTSLSGGSGTSPTGRSEEAFNQLSQYETGQPSYSQSNNLQGIANQLAQYEASKPGAYQSQYQAQIDALLQQINNREPFKYDFNADPLYQQYKDQYQTAGKMAMQDTLGTAAGLTGGYGNSYATTAGNQAYQGYLQQLNGVVPELYGMAYNRYQDQGDDLYNRTSLYTGLDASDYSRHRDDVGDYYQDLGYAYNKYNDTYDREYGQYSDSLNAWMANRDYGLNKYQATQDQANWQQEYNLALQQASGGGGASSKDNIGGVTMDSLAELAANLTTYGSYAEANQAMQKYGLTTKEASYVSGLLRDYFMQVTDQGVVK